MKKRKVKISRARCNKARYLYALAKSYPKDIPTYAIGGCGIVAEKIAKEMMKKGMTHYKIYVGVVSFSNGICHKHTWMKYGSTIYDPTLEQFKSLGNNYDITTAAYMPHQSFSPARLVKLAEIDPLPDEYVNHVMHNELRTSKFKRIDGIVFYDLKEQPRIAV